jgi:16S rRNA (uracil1498-N3)-methyltransferase
MANQDFTSTRLHLDHPLAQGRDVTATTDQANYLKNVLRLTPGAAILVFNGRDGEWRATLAAKGKRDVTLVIGEQTRPQASAPDVDYLFAPLKRARLDYMVQKATEMGAARLRPVMTQHTIAERINLDRMRANAIEAAEQCGILHIPEIVAPEKLTAVVAAWDTRRLLIFCDESAADASPITTLSRLPRRPRAVLIGPEGGFSADERALLLRQPFVTPISLGPRILRADTAAVAALALVQATLAGAIDSPAHS